MSPHGEQTDPWSLPMPRGIGETRAARPVARALTLAFIVVIGAVPLTDQIFALTRTGGNVPLPLIEAGRIWPRAPQIETIFKDKPIVEAVRTINQSVMRGRNRFESAVQSASPVAASLVPPIRVFITGTLHGGAEDVYAGHDGWLYYRPDVDYVAGRGFLEPRTARAHHMTTGDPVPAILELHKLLAARGIALVLAPVPVKPVIYPEHFAWRYTGAQPINNASYGAFLSAMEDARIPVVDLVQPFMAAKAQGTPLFLATDEHWSPRAPRIAAENIAATLRPMLKGHASMPPTTGPRTLRVANVGDLVRLLAFPAAAGVYPPEEITLEIPPPQAMAEPPVLLLGDSFANIYGEAGLGWGEDAGLPQWLAAELGCGIDDLCVNGDGALASRLALSRDQLRGHDWLRNKRVVVWEFSMRALAAGDWRAGLPMTPPRPAIRIPEVLGAERVHGRIRALSAPPQPGSVPFRDSVVAWWLTDVARDGDGARLPDRLIYVCGMRDNVWTDAARHEIGDQVTLRLLPWGTVEHFVGRYHRAEVEEHGASALPAWWAVTGALADRFAATPLNK